MARDSNPVSTTAVGEAPALIILACPHTRARDEPIAVISEQADLHRPAGRRCGCRPTSTFLFFPELLVAGSGQTLELGRSAPMLMSAG
jgi:hypothetical protein